MTQITGNISPDVTPTSGDGSQQATTQVSIQVGANPGSTQRTQTITVRNSNNTKRIDVILVQDAPAARPTIKVEALAQFVSPAGLRIDLTFKDQQDNLINIPDNLNFKVSSGDPGATTFTTEVLSGRSSFIIRNNSYYTYPPQEDVILQFTYGTGQMDCDFAGDNADYHIEETALPIS